MLSGSTFRLILVIAVFLSLLFVWAFPHDVDHLSFDPTPSMSESSPVRNH